MTYVVCALYKFVELKDFVELRQPLLDEMTDKEICGTLLLGNIQVCGTSHHVEHPNLCNIE